MQHACMLTFGETRRGEILKEAQQAPYYKEEPRGTTRMPYSWLLLALPDSSWLLLAHDDADADDDHRMTIQRGKITSQLKSDGVLIGFDPSEGPCVV